jgi:hypothetical protein
VLFFDQLEFDIFIHTALLPRLDVDGNGDGVNIEVPVLVKEVLGRPRLTILTAIYQNWHIVVFYVEKQLTNSFKLFRPVLLILEV